MVRKAEQSERTRRALIDAAIRLFGERGYRATPLKAIGEAAGVSHGVIPFHFGSKEGLLLAVVERCFRDFTESVLAPLGDGQHDYGVEDLHALMRSQTRFGEEHPEAIRLFMVLMFEALGPSPELAGHFRAFHARVHELGRAWVAQGIQRGTVRADLDAAAAVDAVLSFFTGARAHTLLLGPSAGRERVYESMFEILRSAISTNAIEPARAPRRGGKR